MVQNLPGNQNPQRASPNVTTMYKKKYFFNYKTFQLENKAYVQK